MYKKDKIILMIISILCCVISFKLKIDYSIVASDGITIISIVLAIYMTSVSGLISSKLVGEMSQKRDKQLVGKSQLGVLKSYLKNAVKLAIFNMVISGIILIVNNKLESNTQKNLVYYVLSALGVSSLADNIFLMYLIFEFMINRQLLDR